MYNKINIETIDIGDRVEIHESGTVVHVHSNGRVDVKWDIGGQNSVNAELLVNEE